MTTLTARLALHPTSVLCDALYPRQYQPGVLRNRTHVAEIELRQSPEW